MARSSSVKEPLSGGSAFRVFLEAWPEALVASDRGGRILYANAGAEGLFGYGRGELAGQPVEVLVPEPLRAGHARHRDAYWAAPRSRVMAEGRDLLARRKDGSGIFIDVSLGLLPVRGGPIALSAVRDVTGRRREHERLRRAYARLEGRMAERTAELLSANKALRHEMAERVHLQREVLGISEREQQRIGQDLHDNLGQTLTAVTYFAQVLLEKIEGGATPTPKDAAEIVKLVSGVIEQVRGLARGLYPVELEVHGLVPALRELAAVTAANHGIVCEVRHDGGEVTENPAVIQLYRIAQEAVTNAVRHGRPKKVAIRLTSTEGGADLEVEDDGIGLPSSVPGKEGMGMHIMRYRASIIGASLDVRRRKHGGTVVSCSWRRAPDHGQ